jgi:hypothetical protein
MKLRILDGVGIGGRVAHPGEIVDVGPDDFLNLLASGRAEALDRNDHAKAIDASTRATLRLERVHGARRRW